MAPLPPDVKQKLKGDFPSNILDSVDLRIDIPYAMARSCCHPSASLVKVASNPGPDQIVIHPDWWKPGSNDVSALVAHELVHIQQRQQDPNFDWKYRQAAMDTAAQGLPPWDNPYEKPAYGKEQEIRQRLNGTGRYWQATTVGSPGRFGDPNERFILRPSFTAGTSPARRGLHGYTFWPEPFTPPDVLTVGTSPNSLTPLAYGVELDRLNALNQWIAVASGARVYANEAMRVAITNTEPLAHIQIQVFDAAHQLVLSRDGTASAFGNISFILSTPSQPGLYTIEAHAQKIPFFSFTEDQTLGFEVIARSAGGTGGGGGGGGGEDVPPVIPPEAGGGGRTGGFLEKITKDVGKIGTTVAMVGGVLIVGLIALNLTKK